MRVFHRAAVGLALLIIGITPFWLRIPRRPDALSEYVFGFPHLWLVVALAVAWALSGFSGWRRWFSERWPRALAFLMALYAGWAWASQSWALMASFPPSSVNYRPDVAFGAAVGVLAAVGFGLVLLALRVPPSALTGVLAGVMALVGGVMIGQALLQGPLGLGWLGEGDLNLTGQGANVVVADGVRWLRPSGLLPHPNNAAGVLAVGLFAAGGWLMVGPVWRRWLVTAAFGVGFAALLLTFSRSAWLGVAVAFPVAIGLSWPLLRADSGARRQLGVTVGLCVVIGGVFLASFRPYIAARTAGLGADELTQASVDAGQIEGVEARSLRDRVVFRAMAMEMIRANRVLGVGIGNGPWQISGYLMGTDLELRANYVHNVYLAAWGDLGTVGLVLYVGAMVAGMLGAVVMQRRQPSPHRAGLVAGFVALAAAGWFDYYAYALLPVQLLWWGALAGSLGE